MATVVDPAQFATNVGNAVRQELQKLADPIIEETVARVAEDLRQRLRKRVAEMVVGMLDMSYDAEHLGQRLRITVNLAKPEGQL